MIIITGGGTGGHLAIARALAQELQRREIPAVYIGSLYGQDRQWFAGDSSLGNHSSDFMDFGVTADHQSSSTPKSIKSPTSTTAIPRILKKNKGAECEKSCREQTSLESTKVDSSSTPKSIKSPTSNTAKPATAVQGEAEAGFFRIPRILKKDKGAECEKSCREQTAPESTFSQSHDIEANAAIPSLRADALSEAIHKESTKVDSSSTPKFAKSPTSTTAKPATAVQGVAEAGFFRIPRILKKDKGAECEKSCREQTALESTFSQSHDIKANAAIPSLRADTLSEAIHKESTKVDSSSAPQNPLFQQCYFLNTSGVVNKKGFKKLASIYAQLRAALRVRKIFAKHKVRAVISVGGFSAGPASLAAILLRKPLFIHEQNAIQGRLNSLLAPFAKAVFNSFHPPFPPYPIKQEALQRRRIRTEFQSIIFIGGSQGAKAINDLALQAAPKLLARGIRIIHQCGEKDLERVRQAYQKVDSSLLDSSDSKPLESSFDTSSSQPPKLTLFGFDKDLIKHLDKADICVARAGASSIWENAALSLPTIYIPYPYAANNHQLHNASYFTNQGLGLMITEQDLSTKPAQAAQKGAEQKVDSSEHSTDIRAMDLAKFFALLSQLESNLEAISTNLSQTITENGAQSIITQILAALEPATPTPPK